MKLTNYKGYYIRPCHAFPSTDECSVSAFPGSTGIFYFKSMRAAKCYITQHLIPKP